MISLKKGRALANRQFVRTRYQAISTRPVALRLLASCAKSVWPWKTTVSVITESSRVGPIVTMGYPGERLRVQTWRYPSPCRDSTQREPPLYKRDQSLREG